MRGLAARRDDGFRLRHAPRYHPAGRKALRSNEHHATA
jgi:hypothetical protein